jgi:hypothetical protein
LTKKKEADTKEKAQVGTLGMSSLSELLESLMDKEQAMHASTKNKKIDNKMKQKMAYIAFPPSLLPDPRPVSLLTCLSTSIFAPKGDGA